MALAARAAEPAPHPPEVLDVSSTCNLVPRRARRALSVALAALTLLGTAGCRDSSARSSPEAGGGAGSARVTRVVDGDTIEVDLAGHDEKVRLLGIDTPETHHPTKPVQCYGKEASDRTTQLLPAGTDVRLERDDEERDDYGRLLAYVYRSSDDLFVNLDLVQQGYASLLTIRPNVAHLADLTAAESSARAHDLGLWGRCGGPGRPAT
ncbi:MAG: thermonuclease family protein [Acidimicrobiales bacterium]